jgi:hypothetical protein
MEFCWAWAPPPPQTRFGIPTGDGGGGLQLGSSPIVKFRQ